MRPSVVMCQWYFSKRNIFILFFKTFSSLNTPKIYVTLRKKDNFFYLLESFKNSLFPGTMDKNVILVYD